MSAPINEAITADTPHVQASSANTATPAAITTPKASAGGQKAGAVYLTVRTNGCFVTLDGTVPTAANGIELPVGLAPVRLPVPPPGIDIKFCSANAAAASVVNALFVAA